MGTEHTDPAWSKPVLRWAGSKRKLLPVIRPIISRQNPSLYIEPFSGSACVFFAEKPASAVLSDVNPELIGFYQTLKSHPRRLARAVSRWDDSEATYYSLREKAPDELEEIERAARFFYLNRFCFNGIYRTNKAGVFNVPRGKKTGGIPTERELYRASIALRNARILNCDFATTGKFARKGALYYFDPPYDYTGRIERGEYGPNCFTLSDIERLGVLLETLNQKGAKFLLSYIETNEISGLSKAWVSSKVTVSRQVASFARFRQPIKEVLISNFPQNG